MKVQPKMTNAQWIKMCDEEAQKQHEQHNHSHHQLVELLNKGYVCEQLWFLAEAAKRERDFGARQAFDVALSNLFDDINRIREEGRVQERWGQSYDPKDPTVGPCLSGSSVDGPDAPHLVIEDSSLGEVRRWRKVP